MRRCFQIAARRLLVQAQAPCRRSVCGRPVPSRDNVSYQRRAFASQPVAPTLASQARCRRPGPSCFGTARQPQQGKPALAIIMNGALHSNTAAKRVRACDAPRDSRPWPSGGGDSDRRPGSPAQPVRAREAHQNQTTTKTHQHTHQNNRPTATGRASWVAPGGEFQTCATGIPGDPGRCRVAPRAMTPPWSTVSAAPRLTCDFKMRLR